MFSATATKSTSYSISATMAGSRPVVAQPQSRLLSLPAEVRLGIFDYMSLAPTIEGQTAWLGFYFTCRQLLSEMCAHLNPAAEFQNTINKALVSSSVYCHRRHFASDPPMSPKLRLADPVFGLVQGVTLHVPWKTSEELFTMLRVVFALYLNHLRVTTSESVVAPPFTGWGPYGDLKSLHPKMFLEPVQHGVVNCKKVTFCLEHLADEEDGRDKTTELSLIVPRASAMLPVGLHGRRIGVWATHRGTCQFSSRRQGRGREILREIKLLVDKFLDMELQKVPRSVALEQSIHPDESNESDHRREEVSVNLDPVKDIDEETNEYRSKTTKHDGLR
ncbi:hypothetical protein BDV96DRAFT_688507 [Lophiotrema nucula]|uniref:Uncharacterized protein n=1 Tax=Lophiotrema nucula TaxID=690887 RepID=A0A6A5Z256_9PLEO|nr:hypothetical protein BDV96DRAFT_688507 [Lophiotrema nucula]